MKFQAMQLDKFEQERFETIHFFTPHLLLFIQLPNVKHLLTYQKTIKTRQVYNGRVEKY